MLEFMVVGDYGMFAKPIFLFTKCTLIYLLFKPHAEGTILCPTPVRPNFPMQKFDSWPQPSTAERRGSLKVSSTHAKK